MLENKKIQWPGMSREDKEQQAKLIAAARETVKKEPTFESTQAAIKLAVAELKRDKYSFPSVWKEPPDIGKKYAVVHTQNREKAGIGGYSEVVDEQRIFDIANGRTEGTDTIKEV